MNVGMPIIASACDATELPGYCTVWFTKVKLLIGIYLSYHRGKDKNHFVLALSVKWMRVEEVCFHINYSSLRFCIESATGGVCL